MKIVNICGGLGNQMFQYAFAMSLKARFPDEEVLVDTQHYHTVFLKYYKGINLQHNGYEIDTLFPNAPLKEANWRQLMKLSYYIPNCVLSRIARRYLPIRKTEYVAPRTCSYQYLPEVYTLRDCYYEGYWQCAKYFENIKEKLRCVFHHPTPNAYNKEMIERIETTQSVGVHVRRGDYLNTSGFKGICDVEYYKKSLDLILSDGLQHTFFIFSNDLEWSQQHFSDMLKGHDLVFVTNNKGKDSCWDMFLMTYCKDLIIANSSFSWWGAFLNKNVDRVLAPEPWIYRKGVIDVYANSWIRISGQKR